MGQAIVALEGFYLVWSSIVDAPITLGMTLEELQAWTRDEYGQRGLDGFDQRMARVDAKGTSSFDSESADDVMWLNRAAEYLRGWNRKNDRSPLSKAEIVEWYIRRKEHPTMRAIRLHRRTLPKCDPCVADDGNGGGMLCVCWGTGVREIESAP
jgi:hypothetical protein